MSTQAQKEQRLLDRASLIDWPRIASALRWDISADPSWMDDEQRARFWMEVGRQTEHLEFADAVERASVEIREAFEKAFGSIRSWAETIVSRWPHDFR